MKGWISNTHHDWFDFLASKQRVWAEVNFWTPSDFYVFRGAPGSPFFFRLKAPRNKIGGFGYFQRFDRLPEWLAWECFGEGNGAPSLETMSARLAAIRERSDIRGGTEFRQIGCIVLAEAVFFSPEEWVDQPTDWQKSNLRYAGYSLTEGEGRRVWHECLAVAGQTPGAGRPDVSRELPDGRWGDPVLIRPRLGQGAFRLAVTEAYGRACAATGEHSLPALEASHIVPFAENGPHEVSNGLLLRSDLHRLFDRGYVSVGGDHRLLVSERLREHFQNGKSYYPMHGQPIRVPDSVADRPDPELLQLHRERRFLG